MIKLTGWTIHDDLGVRRRMHGAGLSGLLVTHLPDIRYLSGFTGSSAALAVTRRAARLFTDGRYRTQAAEEVKAAKVEIVSAARRRCGGAVARGAARRGERRLRSRMDHGGGIGALEGRPCLADCGARFLVPLAGTLVETLRLVKDEDELGIMREAALMGCRLFDHILGFIRPGLRRSKWRRSSSTRRG